MAAPLAWHAGGMGHRQKAQPPTRLGSIAGRSTAGAARCPERQHRHPMAAGPTAPALFHGTRALQPHQPWYVAQSDLDRYPLDALPLPRVLANDLDDVPDIAKTWALNPADHATITGNGQWKQAVQAYLASITFTDRQIGRVLDALKSSPAADNTTVVLWSDNGFHLGEKLHWRKFTLWEEATRVPFIIVPPRGANPNAQVIETPVSLLISSPHCSSWKA